MNKKTKQLLASAFTAATLFGTIVPSVEAVVSNADNVAVQSNLSSQQQSNDLAANQAMEALKSYANNFIKVSGNQLIISNPLSIQAYIQANLKSLNQAGTNFTVADYYTMIASGVAQINSETSVPGNQLQSDGSVSYNVNTNTTTANSNGPISKSLASNGMPAHKNYWWGTRYYSTNKSGTNNMAYYFSKQSNYFWNLTAGWAATGVVAAAATMGVTAVGSVAGGGLCTLMATEFSDVSSKLNLLVSQGRANHGVIVDINRVPRMYSVYQR
ncbi:MAG: hypothetical protein LBI43_00815 [Streptococcaceae bacterium]|nr:hypothetical protein [Streptococcaceae bacterium]